MTLTGLILAAHVAGGAVALLSGLGAMLTEKGGDAHIRWGRIYYWAMAVVALSALVLAIIRPLWFFVALSVFSFYFVFYGRRATDLKKLHVDESAAWIDWTALGLFGIFSLSMATMGIVDPTEFTIRLATVPLVFGLLGLGITYNQIRRFDGGAEAGDWLGEHVVGMGAGYIATVTAVAVVNAGFLPAPVVWLTPTVVGTGLIFWALNRYRSTP